MPDVLIVALSFLLTTVFAAVWGAHVFETAVMFRVWAAEPATALPAFVATPYMAKGARFWRALAPTLYAVASIALIAAVIAGLQTHLALAIGGACGLIHLGMIILIFMPTNVKLGFYSGAPVSLDPQMVTTLVKRWGRWNLVRVGLETIGLVAALIAFKAS